MTTAFRTVLFWGALALAVLMVVALATGRSTAGELIPVLAAIGYAVAGRVLTARHPENAVGWIVSAVAIVLVLGGLTNGYLAARPAGDPLLVAQLAALLSLFAWNLWLTGLVGIALPLVFPDGRVLWPWVAWLGITGTLLGMLAITLAPGALEAEIPLANPLGVAGAGGLMDAVGTVGSTLTALATVCAGAAVVVRLRRSHGVERQQLKWFAYVASMIVAGLTAAAISSGFADARWAQVLAVTGWFTALAMIAIGIPLATGFAVLRHRLYEIDVVIKRTLVYGALLVALTGIYLGGVLLLQLVVSSSSDLAVAGSTLAVVVVSRPLRARIRELVDRRFYRRTYDAARTIEGFGARAREELSLEALSEELRAVVADTMQPAHVSVWLVQRRAR